jgi:hypothetical protein
MSGKATIGSCKLRFVALRKPTAWEKRLPYRLLAKHLCFQEPQPFLRHAFPGTISPSSLSHLSERICRSVALRFSLPSDDRPAILRFGFWQLPTAEKQLLGFHFYLGRSDRATHLSLGNVWL